MLRRALDADALTFSLARLLASNGRLWEAKAILADIASPRPGMQGVVDALDRVGDLLKRRPRGGFEGAAGTCLCAPRG